MHCTATTYSSLYISYNVLTATNAPLVFSQPITMTSSNWLISYNNMTATWYCNGVTMTFTTWSISYNYVHIGNTTQYETQNNQVQINLTGDKDGSLLTYFSSLIPADDVVGVCGFRDK